MQFKLQFQKSFGKMQCSSGGKKKDFYFLLRKEHTQQIRSRVKHKKNNG